ncbi:CoA pyrophosphatase [Kiloniella majae]|uniref:CoA pyrophosphatase n=1 Tax=Kiloniella majae TaxID=1938558 RepID=UPI000A2797D2|nr:CoA pyrophosphatase [Kiloniella majae]
MGFNWTSQRLTQVFAQQKTELSEQDTLRGDHDLNPGFFDPTRNKTPAAVVVPLVEREHGFTVLLTKRTDHLHDHAGQVSFPGGRVDPTDRNHCDTALRELEEEVGLPRKHVSIIGELDTYVTRTGFVITPVVGLIKPPFPVEPDSFEVAEVFEVPLNFFLKPGSRQRHFREFEGYRRYYYAFPFNDYFIWGATAGMLVNLCEVLSLNRDNNISDNDVTCNGE